MEGDAAAARRLLDEALGLWRGPALADVGFESFAQAEIARLEELRVAALEERIDARLSEGEHALVVAELEQLSAEHPSRERLVGLLMLALYRCGRQTDALEVYTRGRLRLDEELGLEPSPELQRLQEAILRHDDSLVEPRIAPATARAAPEAPVPLPATQLIGREREIREVVDLIGADSARLVTLVGPGGVGKTRLALELAGGAIPRFRDGVAWVELAAVGRAEHVPGTVVRALAITVLPGETPEEALLRGLEAKQLLLAIDNFEHVLEAASLVAQMLAHCPILTVLATSREALDVAGEHAYPVAPLAVPSGAEPLTLADVEASPAGQLFVSAAKRHNPATRLDDAQRALDCRDLRTARRHPARDRACSGTHQAALARGAGRSSGPGARHAHGRPARCSRTPAHASRHDRLELPPPRPPRGSGVRALRRVRRRRDARGRRGDHRRRPRHVRRPCPQAPPALVCGPER